MLMLDVLLGVDLDEEGHLLLELLDYLGVAATFKIFKNYSLCII